MRDIEATEEYRREEKRHAIDCALAVGLISTNDEDGAAPYEVFRSFWTKFSADKDDLRRMVRQDMETRRREKRREIVLSIVLPIIGGLTGAILAQALLKLLSIR